MPFKIIRNDITKVKADAIVNTANPRPVCGSGTDTAIYQAAGKEDLLKARKKIGKLARGEAAVTPAFRLSARYIIHTVGPAWEDGQHGEFDILHSCYRKSLMLAEQLKCESIAFPLISTGNYGFPRDQALQVALEEFENHLKEHDREIILVVFDPETYQISEKLQQGIDRYIDDNYVQERLEKEYYEEKYFGLSDADVDMDMEMDPEREYRRRRRKLSRRKKEDPYHDSNVIGSAAPQMPSLDYEKGTSFARPAKKKSLDYVIDHLEESFQERLLRLIDEKGMTDPEVYKKANLDRKLFSKIRCNPAYVPKKKTAIALAIALQLNMDDTRDLLRSAGLALSNSNKSDVIISFCIEHGIYNILEIDSLLFRYDQPTLA